MRWFSSSLLVVMGVASCLEATPDHMEDAGQEASDGSSGTSAGASTTDASNGGSVGPGSATDGGSSSGSEDGGTGPASTSGGTAADTTGGDGAWRAFVTSTDTPANIATIDQGDVICNGLATAAGLPARFKVLLSAPNADARDRLIIDRPIENMQGEVVAFDDSDLWDGGLSATITYDERGREAQLAWKAWTGTGVLGQVAAAHCVSWTSGEMNDAATVGDLTMTDGRWVDSGEDRCNRRHHLYCIEQ